MGAVAERGILGLTAGAKVEGLARLGIHFVGGGLPAHEFIIEQPLDNGSANCGRWKKGGRVLAIFLIPVDEDAGGGVQG